MASKELTSIRRGGGIASDHRSYAYKLPQKVRRLALKSAYSEEAVENKFVPLDLSNLQLQKLPNLQSSCSFEHRF